MSSPSRPPVQARPAVHALAGSLIREVANSAMGRADVLPFWFGESDQPTADYIRAAAVQSLDAGETFYSQNLGRPYLREAIAAYLGRLHGRPLDAARVGVVASGDTGLMVTMQLLLSPGDRVVAVTPLWPNICEMPRVLGAEVVRVPLSSTEGRWHLDLDRLLAALTPETRLLIINSPSNPTGWTIEEAQVDVLLAHCRRHGIWVLSDDVYERLVYDPARVSAPSFLRRYEAGDRIISVNSFSKAWRMTGWRAGWMVVPEVLADDLAKLIEYNFSCVFEPVQRAAVAALEQGEPDVARLRTELQSTRRVLGEALRALPGVEVPEAGGAMYAFFRLDGFADSLDLAKRLVAEVGLGLAPGAAFGPEGDGWLRWCHAVSDPQKLLAGVDRLAGFVARHRTA
ncbi:aminotransferase class I/II-fold pyridoxal phosphate-dependent enzyme [Ideonella dechloratans]|uniref:Aminotransferase class I/II-fold pyridoxal phosphate-dependent enzyme n=1 Tax=Ideonella dechloratans TaxID=36863 RepID=A0A643FCM6_IDEDE|nr:pyridoxal phosphate-dependent aminotransferase [Ideonella dechloratans]KAB0583053.1 aminotransferase class I/II-fold pyridoxal phosphate-dependent enzyme [Ideonella dechloratans]UFU09548.1 pyridoxal phosphate-dependent aminotransferase [Ideonella dechloratans]